MENPYVFKRITLLKKEGSLMSQGESPVFLLSAILEDFISEHLNDSRYELELAFAGRLDSFLLNDDKDSYYDA